MPRRCLLSTSRETRAEQAASSGIEPLLVLFEWTWPIPNPSMGKINMSPIMVGSVNPVRSLTH